MALPDKPLTRNEQYLASIAGQGSALPEKPLTRTEQYLDYIAKNSGGSGVTIDPDPTQGSVNAVSSGGVYTALQGKQDSLSIDTSPTAESGNPVSSGGVYTALSGKQDTITVDASPTDGSSNPVSSGGVHTALAGKQDALTFDDVPVRDSQNPVKSGGVWEQLEIIKNAGGLFDTSWGEIISNLHDYNIGDLIHEPWIDMQEGSTAYDNPWRVNHFENVEIEGGSTVNGMWLQTKYAHPFGVQFSHQRAFLACPNGLPVGTYYFTIESAWGANVAAGDVVCFTTTIPVPVGGRVAGCYGAPDQAKSAWRIYTYSSDGKTILETIVPTFTASGTNLGTVKASARNGNLNSMQETAYGWNRWKTSAIRQYLNSDAAKGFWWTPQDAWDIAPDQLMQKDGFLHGLPEIMKNVLRPVKTITYTNTVQDGGEADITYDKVTLISKQQMYLTPQIAGEGEAHDYWKQLRGSDSPFPDYTAMDILKQYAVENHSSAQYVRLRSAYRGCAYYAWYVSPSGGVYSNGSASNAFRFQPLVFIG